MTPADRGAIVQRVSLGFAYVPGSIRVHLGTAELLADELDPVSGLIAVHVPFGVHGELTIAHQAQIFRAAAIEDLTIGVAERCIYCGAIENLTDEHVIPYGLQGNFVIKKGSCRECARVTGRLEGAVLRGAFLPARIALGLRTRRKRDRPSTLPVVVRSGDEEKTIEIPTSAYPAYLTLPTFDSPAYLRGDPSPNIRLLPERTHIIPVSAAALAPPGPESKALDVKLSLTLDVYALARLLAKIAHGFLTVADKGEVEAYLPRGILVPGEDIGRWVGGAPDVTVRGDGGHGVNLWTLPDGEIHMRVRLFAQLGGPEYHIVAGRVVGDSSGPTRIVAVRR